MGAAIPFTFQDLVKNTNAAADAPKMVRPRQAALTLLASLEKAKDKYVNAEKAKEAAKQSFERIADASKKRRINSSMSVVVQEE